MKYGCLVIDMQNGVCVEESYRLQETIANIQQLLSWCHKEAIEVVYVRHDDQCIPVTRGQSAYEIIPQLTPLADEQIIDKFYNSAFLKTNLDDYLKSKGIDTLIIVGMQSEYCIDATIKSAFERGYRVIVPQACTTTCDQESIDAATLCDFYERVIWNNRYANIIPLQEVCK